MTIRTDELAIRLLELTDQRDWAAREALLAGDCELVTPDAALRGPAAITTYSEAATAGFSDARHHIELVVASGDVAAVEGTWIGAHTAPIPTPEGDVPATGKVVSLPFMMTVRAEGDRARAVHVTFDQLGFMAQLGLLPVPQSA